MRHRLVPALVLAALVLPASASAGGTVGHVRFAIDTHASFPSYDQTARRHGFVILHAWQRDRMQALKAANPALRVLVYKNLSFSNYMNNSGYSSVGVPAAEADRDHPEWFLLNTSGERFTSWSHSWSWAMDVGSSSYQQRWADNVIAELQSQGWDGVFIDDTNPTMRYHYTPSAIAKYPSDDAYSAATRSAVATIGPRVRAAGKLAIANIGSWAGYPATARDWLQFVDGGLDEMFIKWGNRAGDGYGGLGRWETQLDELKAADRRGKFFLAIAHSDPTDAGAARYGYATMLLGSNGMGYFALAHDYTDETWFPEYDYDLGAPLGPETVDASGVHRRAFERGLVLVNPTDHAESVAFGGTYAGSGLDRATGATMAPNSGLVLRGERPEDAPPATTVPPPITVLATAPGPHQVGLRWTGPVRKGIRYRVTRNGRAIRVVRQRHLRDRRLRPGHRYRYRVVAIGQRGRKLRRSRMVRIRTTAARPRLVSAAAAPARTLHATLSTGPRRWKRAYLERRVDGRWRRLTRPVRPRTSMWFRLPRGGPGPVRVAVEPAAGRALRSGPVR